jgi:alpha-D-xyloside xylohydrolase
MMRGLPMDFPDEISLRKIDDSFMFGPAFLVHPVTRAMYHADNPPPPTIATEYLRSLDGQPGLSLEYFNGIDLTKSASKTIDSKVDHTWPGPPLANPPAGLDSLENFSARWEGTLIAPEEGQYEIGLEGDDGYRLWLNGKVVVQDWNNGPTRYKGTRVTFHKGQTIPVKIEYFQGILGRALRFGWRTPSQTRELEAQQKTLNTTLETLLPSGAAWYDFWTNERLAGGQTVKKDCPMDIFPLYVRAGTIVPLGPIMQYATEKPEAPYEIRIYPGANASFTLYEDDNETYNYEKGEYATYELSWDDAARILTVGPRKGTYPGMVLSRELRVVVAAPSQNAGIDEGSVSAKTITYRGQQVQLSFRGD